MIPVPIMLRFRIPDHEIRAIAGRDGAAVAESADLRGAGREPFGNPFDRMSSLARRGPDYRQGESQRRDAAPRAYEITFREELHFRRARRVICRDGVDDWRIVRT